ncbi:Hypothetical_protein [Hexamita inflata]|uniref:Hypothetical_protein n=1 Tax=Hexamita inflata TaxID=28002 RepID=A0ABP1GY95_9EUKA
MYDDSMVRVQIYIMQNAKLKNKSFSGIASQGETNESSANKMKTQEIRLNRNLRQLNRQKKISQIPQQRARSRAFRVNMTAYENALQFQWNNDTQSSRIAQTNNKVTACLVTSG